MRIRTRTRTLTLMLLFALAALHGHAAARPELRSERVGSDRLRLRWPAASGAFRLESARTLGAAAAWQTVIEPISVVDGWTTAEITVPSDGEAFFRLREESGGVTGVVEISPARGEVGVSVWREVIVRLAQPLAADVMVDTSRFRASFAGRTLLSRAAVGLDRTALTLFFLEDLPGAARIRVEGREWWGGGWGWGWGGWRTV